MINPVQVNLDFNAPKWSLLLKERPLSGFFQDRNGLVFNASKFRNELICYQEASQEIKHLSNRVTQLQISPNWEKANYVMRGICLVAIAIAAIALSAGIVYLLCFTGGNPEAALMIPLFVVPTLSLAGYCFISAIHDFKTALENLEAAQDKLADKKRMAAQLESDLTRDVETLGSIKKSLTKENEYYEQVSQHNPQLSHGLHRQINANVIELQLIDMYKIV